MACMSKTLSSAPVWAIRNGRDAERKGGKKKKKWKMRENSISYRMLVFDVGTPHVVYTSQELCNSGCSQSYESVVPIQSPPVRYNCLSTTHRPTQRRLEGLEEGGVWLLVTLGFLGGRVRAFWITVGDNCTTLRLD